VNEFAIVLMKNGFCVFATNSVLVLHSKTLD